MSWIWILPALLGITLGVTFYPLFSRRGSMPLPVGLEGNPRVVLEDRRDMLLRQIRELELTGGETTPPSGNDPGAGTIRADLEEELGSILDQLQTADRTTSPAKTADNPRNAVDIAAGISVLLVITVLSGGLYLFLGTPFPPQASAMRQASPHGAGGNAPDINTMVTNLAAKMRQNPDDLVGHIRMGRAYAVLERYTEAITAYTHVLTRDPQNTDAAAGLARILVESDQEDQFKRGVELFQGVLQQQPNHLEALWVMGSIAFQTGDRDMALTQWRKLLKQAPADSPMRQEVEQAIRQAEALPPRAQKSAPETRSSP
ncbi:MAG: tetratricopeptide repeat protein [Magnetococcales bacterium]|nr:tetratricopeptide repeat protein [Magnetococcales bacterium]